MKNLINHTWLVVLLLLGLGFASCSDDDDNSNIDKSLLVGIWIDEEEGENVIFAFESQGTGYTDQYGYYDEFEWELNGNLLTLYWADGDAEKVQIKKLTQNTLVWGDEEETITFHRYTETE